MPKQCGASLIETAIVIAIFGILSAIAMPGLSELLQARHATSFASVLHTELNLARYAAIMRGYRTVVCRSPDGTTCRTAGPWTQGLMSFVDIDGNGDRAPNEPILRITGGDTLTHVRTRFSEGRRIIAFRPDGRGGGTNLTATVCDATGKARRTVVVSVAGRVRLGNPGATERCT